MATRRAWSQEDLLKAISEVSDGKASIRHAASKYSIPRSTLHDYVSQKAQVGDRPGPDPYLTKDEEEELVQWAFKMSEIGYGQTSVHICEMVKRILDLKPRANPFRDNRPGKDWWYAFLKRHPKVSVRVPQALQSCRASACTTDALDRWFVGYEQFLLTHDLVDSPERIWNCDESGFPLCPKSGKVIAPQGVRQVYQVTGSNKQQITTLCCINAAGDIIPPMHVFPGLRCSYNPLEGSVDGAYF